MDKDALLEECARLHLKLSKQQAITHDLEVKLAAKTNRIKNLTQQVLDKEKSMQRLREIVDSLKEVDYISEETSEILKVTNFMPSSEYVSL